jgi:hypothetical protein
MFSQPIYYLPQLIKPNQRVMEQMIIITIRVLLQGVPVHGNTALTVAWTATHLATRGLLLNL